MKKQISVLFTMLMIIGSMSLMAQKPFAGTISFGMSAEGTEDPNVISQLATVTRDVIVKGNNSKTVANFQGVGIIAITNGDYKFQTQVFDFPGIGKFYIETKEAEIIEELAKTKFEFDYKTDEKTIQGYNCKKVEITVTDLESDDQSTMVVWVTNDLLLGDNINFCTYPGLKGYPLRVEQKQEDSEGNSFTIVTEATKLTPDKKLSDSSFLRPSDAKPASEAPDDVKQMLGIE